MKRQYVNEIKAIIILAAAIILFASLISFVPEDLSWYTSHPNSPAKNLIRIFGAYMAGSLFFVLGYSAYGIVLFLFFWGWEKLSSREVPFNIYKLISFTVLFCSLSSFLSMIGSQVSAWRFHRSGILGVSIADFFISYFGQVGTFIIVITLGILSLIVLGEFLISPFLFRISGTLKDSFGSLPERILSRKEKFLKTPERPRLQFNKLQEQLKQKEKQKLGKILAPSDSAKQARAVPEPNLEIRTPSKPNIRMAFPDKKEESK